MMKPPAILLALVAPLVLVCTDAPGPPSGEFAALGAESLPPAGEPENPQRTVQLVLRRVWAGPDVDYLGVPTPDGRSLVFTDWSKGYLAVRDMTTGDIRYLTDQGEPGAYYAESPVLSPDGKRVAFSWYRDWTYELRIIGLDGSDPSTPFSRRNTDIYAWPYAWSPDGRHIVAMVYTGSRAEIDLISVEDGSVRTLREIEADYPAEVNFTPDGRSIVYDLQVDRESGQRDIFILPLDGGRETRLVENPADDFLLGWVPDTDRVLFSSDRNGTPGAWVVRVVDGRPAGEPVLVKADLWRAQPMGFTADGDFYFGIQVGNRNIQIATLDPENGELLSPPTPVDPRQTGSAFWPVWSPDGRYLSWMKTNGNAGRRSLVVRSTETGERREVQPRYGQGHAARWSPDGRRWLMTGADGASRNRLDLIDVRTGGTEPLRTFRGDTVCCDWYDWSPDGRTVYYKADLRTESWLAALDVESGRERILYRVDQPEYIPVWNDVSPDGRELAFWLYQLQEPTARLLVIPTEASAGSVTPREVLSFEAEGNPPATDAKWTRDGRHLLFIKREADPTVGRLWRVPAAGGEPEPLGLARKGLGRVPAVHPDGRTVAFAEGQEHTEIWVMESYLPRR